jgi:hypothetical protein
VSSGHLGRGVGNEVGAMAKSEVMFTIEFVVVTEDRPEQPKVIETMTSPRVFLYDVEHRARLVLRKAKRQPSPGSPNGYQIRDAEGQVVVRSWESKVIAHSWDSKSG